VFRLPLRVPLCARGLSERWKASAEGRIGQNGFGLGGPPQRGRRHERVRAWQSLASRAPGPVEELHPVLNPGLMIWVRQGIYRTVRDTAAVIDQER
jgi:hypothetical protein